MKHKEKMHYGRRMKEIRIERGLDANIVAKLMNIRPSSYHYLESRELLHTKSIREFSDIVGITEYEFYNSVEHPEQLMKLYEIFSQLPPQVQEEAIVACGAVIRAYTFNRK